MYGRQNSIYGRLEAQNAPTSAYMDLYGSAASSSTARSSFSTSIMPQSPWDGDMSILPEIKLSGIYDNPYDYLPNQPQLGLIGQTELEAIIASGILADNTVPISQYVLPEEHVSSHFPIHEGPHVDLSMDELISSDTAQTVNATPAQNEKPASKKYSLNDFYFHNTLGTGSFGRVHLGSFSAPALSPPS